MKMRPWQAKNRFLIKTVNKCWFCFPRLECWCWVVGHSKNAAWYFSFSTEIWYLNYQTKCSRRVFMDEKQETETKRWWIYINYEELKQHCMSLNGQWCFQPWCLHVVIVHDGRAPIHVAISTVTTNEHATSSVMHHMSRRNETDREFKDKQKQLGHL